MLPLSVQLIIAMMPHAINERMALKLEYLKEEGACSGRYSQRPPDGSAAWSSS